MESQTAGGHPKTACVAEETVGQQACESAATRPRQWESNAQGRWQATVGLFRWLVLQTLRVLLLLKQTCLFPKRVWQGPSEEDAGSAGTTPRTALLGDLLLHFAAAVANDLFAAQQQQREDLPPNADNAPMQDASEKRLKEDLALGELDAAEGDAETRKCF
eukprot:5639213-Amphidinium_carterae.2